MTTAKEYEASLVKSAMVYAEIDWPVFPVYGPFKKNVCQCPKGAACERAAKHPMSRLAPNGLLDATVDVDQVQRWWQAWPRANIGIAVPKGYVVLDIDGIDGLTALADRHWSIPETVTAETGRGWHHWFEADIEIRPGSAFMPHVDMRGPGGYVIAPPSLHASGVQYEWERSPDDFPIAPAPDWIYTLVREARESHRKVAMPSSEEPIGEGGRNDTLARIAGAMRRWGCPERAILAALEITNAERCRPPLDDDEVQVIASSVARYSPEQLAERHDWAPHGWEGQAW